MNPHFTFPNPDLKPDPKHTPIFVDNTSAPICKVCDKGKLIPKRVHKFGIMCAIAGSILAIPSIMVAIIFFATSAFMLIDADRDLAIASTAFGGFMLSALAFGTGGLGYFLAQTKKILRCNKCGATVDAS